MNTKSFLRFLCLILCTAFCVGCGGGGDEDRQVDVTWHKDSDGDGYSDGVARFSSNRPVDYYRQDELIATEGDCDDNNATVHPGGVEIDGDGLDQDCNGFEISGPSEVVFDWTTDRCEDLDIPDLPARAFRDQNNQVQLISSHHSVRRFLGADLNNLVHDCGVVMSPHHDADPSMFDDVEWMGATYTENGATVFAIVHNEYHGSEHAGQCNSGAFGRCWYNGLTLAISTDSGLSYHHNVAPPLHLVASSPLQYEVDQGPRGIFHPSNIIKRSDGYYYAIVHRVKWSPPDTYEQWSCLMRTPDLSDPDAWRFWDGVMFEGLFVNPYTDPIADPDDHDCPPIDRDDISDMTQSLTYSEYLDQYILTGTSSNNGQTGFFVSYSDDLINWTERVLLLERDLPWTVVSASDPHYLYPSLLDPASTSRNFEAIGKTAYVYFTRNNRSNGDLDRDMLRVPVEFFDY